jgi:hypothetical protein
MSSIYVVNYGAKCLTTKGFNNKHEMEEFIKTLNNYYVVRVCDKVKYLPAFKFSEPPSYSVIDDMAQCVSKTREQILAIVYKK